MKTAVLLAFFVCASLFAGAQTKLTDKDINDLLVLSKLYSNDNMFQADSSRKNAAALRSPVLKHVVDGLIAMGKADTGVIAKRILQRPDNNDLKLWYVIRSVHYATFDTVKSRQAPPPEIARRVLAQDIDERLLLNNYYSMILGSGIAFLFNRADLSSYNFDLESYGLKNQTEKAILFFRLVDPMIRARFLVLQSMKKYDRFEDLVKRLPLFNGKPYYTYTDFNFPDFGNGNLYDKQSFKQFNINFLAQCELIHLNVDAVSKKIEEGRALYHNSILSKPEYFGFTETNDVLQKLYKQFDK